MIAIVTDVHYRMSLALIRDLGQAGVEVLTCERESCRTSRVSPALGAMSRYTARHVWLPEEGYLDALWELCREVGAEKGRKPALLPVGAATLGALAADRERFRQVCGLFVPTTEQLDLFNSKERVAALAASLHIPTPASYAREPGEDADAFARRLPLPAVVKPVCGEKLGLGCSVLARNGEVLSAICHRRLREYPVAGGPSSCCRVEERPDLADMARAMVRAAGYNGLAMFEFKEDSRGKPRLLEVNPRIWGTFPLTRVSPCGMSRLWCALSWNAGNPEDLVLLPRPREPQRGKMIFAASDLMAAAGYAKRGQPGRALGTAADLVNPFVRDGLFEWGDMAPALAYFRSLVSRGGRT